jgi:nicotinate-nucleotide adenylyltransferase
MTVSASRRRIGVLGGTFDPIHVGHLDAAEAARIELALDEIWLIPSLTPPHRPAGPMASGFHRFAMVALAVAERPHYRACDIELQRAGRSYTIETLQELHASGLLASDIFFIIGVDAFADVHTWRAFPAVLDAANFAVVGRQGRAPEEAILGSPILSSRVAPDLQQAPRDGPPKIFPLRGQSRPTSSTVIRARLRAGEAVTDLVPSCVERHIIAHQLYENG